MFDLGRANAISERAEGAVGRGVTVTANEQGARQREALFRSDDVADALPPAELVVYSRPKSLAFSEKYAIWAALSASRLGLVRCDVRTL